MALYKKEFGNDFELGINLEDYPFLVDKSYANDMCPSFYFKLDDTYYILWIDYLSMELREEESSSRYTIIEAENLGNEENPELQTANGHPIAQFESVIEIKTYLNAFKTRFFDTVITH
jgi:hypothetical protein